MYPKNGRTLSNFDPSVQYPNEFSPNLSESQSLILPPRLHTEEEFRQRLTKPSVLASALFGLLMLISLLGLQSARVYLQDDILGNTTIGLPFTKLAIAHFIPMIFLFLFALIDCCKKETRFSWLHTFLAFIAQIFVIGYYTLLYYASTLIMSVENINATGNLFTIFFSLNMLCLALYCLFWFPERPYSVASGVLSFFFVFLTVC